MEASTTAVAEAAATTCEASSPTKTAAEATSHASAAEAATTAEAHAAASSKAAAAAPGAGITILADFEHASLPIVAIELSDGVASIFGVVKGHDTGALGTTIGSDVDIRTDDGPLLRCTK